MSSPSHPYWTWRWAHPTLPPMLTIILRMLRGVVMGWLTAILIALLRRLLSRAFGGDVAAHVTNTMKKEAANRQAAQNSTQQQAPTPPTYAPTHHARVVDTIYVGMTADQLRASHGRAVREEQNADTTTTWHYPAMTVQLTNGAVTGWDDKGRDDKDLSA